MPESWYKKQFSELNDEALRGKGYDLFVRALGDQRDYIRNAYFKALANKGYHFVTDDCDAGTFGKEPAIIFDRQKSTSYEGQRKVTARESLAELNKYGATKRYV